MAAKLAAERPHRTLVPEVPLRQPLPATSFTIPVPPHGRRTDMTTTHSTNPVTRQRLATSAPLRLTTATMTDMIAHLHADLTGVDRGDAAAHIRRAYPLFQALLTYRLATTPAACATTLDQTLIALALRDDPDSLHDWVGEIAYALAA